MNIAKTIAKIKAVSSAVVSLSVNLYISMITKVRKWKLSCMRYTENAEDEKNEINDDAVLLHLIFENTPNQQIAIKSTVGET